MASAYKTMENALAKLNIYSFENENRCKAEIEAYGFFLDKLNGEISDLLSECFIDTASTYGLSERERIIGAKRDDLSVVERRDMLKLRESICMSSFTVNKIKEAIHSFGLCCEITEYPMYYLVRVEAVGDYSKVQRLWIKNEIEKIMPAHLSVEVIFSGVTWDEIGEKNITFSDMDNLDYSWKEIDEME